MGMILCPEHGKRGIRLISPVLREAVYRKDRGVEVCEFRFTVVDLELVLFLDRACFDSFGFEEGILGSLTDARDRFLKPGGQLIPHGVQLFMVPVEMPQFYEHVVDFWVHGCYSIGGTMCPLPHIRPGSYNHHKCVRAAL